MSTVRLHFHLVQSNKLIIIQVLFMRLLSPQKLNKSRLLELASYSRFSMRTQADEISTRIEIDELLIAYWTTVFCFRIRPVQNPVLDAASLVLDSGGLLYQSSIRR